MFGHGREDGQRNGGSEDQHRKLTDTLGILHGGYGTVSQTGGEVLIYQKIDMIDRQSQQHRTQHPEELPYPFLLQIDHRLIAETDLVHGT